MHDRIADGIRFAEEMELNGTGSQHPEEKCMDYYSCAVEERSGVEPCIVSGSDGGSVQDGPAKYCEICKHDHGEHEEQDSLEGTEEFPPLLRLGILALKSTELNSSCNDAISSRKDGGWR